MIGYLQGVVLFSDGTEIILGTASGVGHQISFHKVLEEGTVASLYISHIIKESSEDLYGFESLRQKKIFEILLSVKGVGPKSGYILLSSLGANQVIDAISLENKKVLSSAPGIGKKSAAQIILDLKDKIHKVKMYSTNCNQLVFAEDLKNNFNEFKQTQSLFTQETEENNSTDTKIINDTIMACKELGFREEKIFSLANKILKDNKVTKPEQLVHLVLKEI